MAEARLKACRLYAISSLLEIVSLLVRTNNGFDPPKSLEPAGSLPTRRVDIESLAFLERSTKSSKWSGLWVRIYDSMKATVLVLPPWFVQRSMSSALVSVILLIILLIAVRTSSNCTTECELGSWDTGWGLKHLIRHLCYWESSWKNQATVAPFLLSYIKYSALRYIAESASDSKDSTWSFSFYANRWLHSPIPQTAQLLAKVALGESLSIRHYSLHSSLYCTGNSHVPYTRTPPHIETSIDQVSRPYSILFGSWRSPRVNKP